MLTGSIAVMIETNQGEGCEVHDLRHEQLSNTAGPVKDNDLTCPSLL